MTVEVVTVWAPRPHHDKWRDDYLALLGLQKRTAEHFGHTHTVVSDHIGGVGGELPGFNVLHAPLSWELMPAMIDGVLARLRYPAKPRTDLVFVDADVLVARDLAGAFSEDWDLGLTRRAHDRAEINNGAMYVRATAREMAIEFFERALARCGTHWGADQEAISAEAAPVPTQDRIEYLGPMRVGYLSMKTHNAVPKAPGLKHQAQPFVVHFKGDTKDWAQKYADRFILHGAHAVRV